MVLLPPVFVAVILHNVVPAVVGVPEMRPVVVFRDNPAGKPKVIGPEVVVEYDHVIGRVPDATM